jgi:hypothetical protein
MKMQAKARVAVAFDQEINEEGAIFPQSTETRQYTHSTTTEVIELPVKPRESKLDHVTASAVYGLTATFMAFIFGLVTEYIPRMLENVLLSVFMGICVGVIAYALMSGDD